MLTDEDYKKIREELDSCTNPLFLFDDDADGLCSFLLLYRYLREGKGVCVKSKPMVDIKYAAKVEEHRPDKVFILDKPLVNQDFLDKIKVPVIWVDHHEPVDRDRVKYFNPRLKGEHSPVTYICYRVVKQDIWLGMVGSVADWYMPDFKDEFIKQYPEYLPKKIKKPEDALFTTQLGLLIKIISFCLKGRTTDVKRFFKTMTRINHPDEIIKQTTPQGKFIYKRYEQIDVEFQPLLKRARTVAKQSKDKLILFKYTENKMSFSQELSNLILYENPEKVTIIARNKSGEFKCSLRSSGKTEIATILKKALIGIKGYGGGHAHACGACIDAEHFPQFIENIRMQL
ncbi:MAG: DHHA1 domain-containing protein [Nanoarchaeota archaeon]|nr:DHHA1 domain-containing protein [Nanoarchaeota archaeon]